MKEKLQKAGEKALEEAKLHLIENGTVLPKNCWLSGQWFALATLKHAGLWDKNVVMNDIDVFNISSYDPHTDRGLIEKREDFCKIEPVLDDPYKNRTFPGVVCDTKYKIVETDHYGILNLTNVKFIGKTECAGFDLVVRFDINSTQCAINTSTKEVVFTDAFVEFVKTKQLKIIETTTTGHSLIRLLKKADELECFVDLEKESQKLLSKDQFVPFFGEKIYNNFLPYEETLYELGITVKEIFFEGQNHRLFKMERQTNLTNDLVAKWHGEFGKPSDLSGFTDFVYRVDDIDSFAKRFEDSVIKEDDVSKEINLYPGGTLTRRFFMEEGFNFEKLEELLKKIKDTDTYIFVVNCFLDWSEIDKWLEALTPKYEHYILKKSYDVYHAGEIISVDEVLANPSEFVIEDVIEDAPDIGKSEANPKVIGSIREEETILILELEKKDELIEYLGYNIDSLEWVQSALSEKDLIGSFVPESELVYLQEKPDGGVEVPEIYKEIEEKKGFPSDMELEPGEIPFN